MEFIFIIIVVLVISFGGVLLFGAPYLPTLRDQVDTGLDMLDLSPGQTLIELGCGDGKVLIAAAGRGLQCVGYELNPFLFVVSWLRTRRYRRQVKVVWGDYWTKQWPPAEGVYAFILQKYMPKLDKKIVQWTSNPVKVVSFAFTIPKKAVVRENSGLYLYKYE